MSAEIDDETDTRALDKEARARATGTRTIVIGPYSTRRGESGPGKGRVVNERAPAARLEEAVGLASAIDLTIVEAMLVNLAKLRPSTFLGKGKVEEIANLGKAGEISLVVMDCALSPVQQRNLEKAWNAKVIDRTGLILEIFGRRARTREGSLQVELAHLEYQKSRLVRSWTHLERQRGGFGFLGGPGETQIETDRRLIQDRMTKITRELATVKRTRALHRTKRQKAPYPVAALVGYTNAGKSTLFNKMTAAGVLAADMLFATLDPTARSIALPSGATAILSDTVGFISDLPTELVAAFRATLEDLLEADVVLHVRDIATPDSEAQAGDVVGVLRGLGVGVDDGEHLIEIWNKIDLVDTGTQAMLATRAEARPEATRPVLVSAVTGEGIGRLIAAIERRTGRDRSTYVVTVPAADGASLAWLHEQTDVIERRADPETGASIAVVRVGPERRGPLEARFPSARKRR